MASFDGCAPPLTIEMESRYQEVQRLIRQRPRRWLVTGVAGFIGSHLLEALL